MDSLLKQRIVEVLLCGWRQQDLANATQKSQATVSKWSSGELVSISMEDAKALANLSCFRAEWIAFGHGEKHQHGGPVIPRERGRNTQRYQRIAEKESHQQNELVLKQRLQFLLDEMQEHDNNLGILLKAWQLCDPVTRQALADTAKVASLARPQQAQRALRTIQQHISGTAEPLALTLNMQEILLLRVFRGATMQIRLALVDAILEDGHGYQLQQMRLVNAAPVPNTTENLSPIETRMLDALRTMRRDERQAVEDLVQAEAREMKNLWPRETQGEVSAKVSGV